MEEMKSNAEAALNSSAEFRRLLRNIQNMTAEEKSNMLTVVENIEQQLADAAQGIDTTFRKSIWRGVLDLLTIGLDPAAQTLINQTTGPVANEEIRFARIEGIKRAVRS